MRIEWLSRGTADRVIIFFLGWGMDATSVRHLKTDCDVAAICDYRNLENIGFDFLQLLDYRQIDVIAWSMGVWAAANLLPLWNIQPSRLVALNGTERPVDDEYGIPARIYRLTERGMNAEGRIKFIARMFADDEERKRFDFTPKRDLQEVCDELLLIREQSTRFQQTMPWNKVYISENDVIFTPSAQYSWWSSRNVHIEKLKGGHFPFYNFETWDEILTL